MEDDNQGPRDDYLHNYTASKVEAKKIFNHPRFEESAAKFWQLLRTDPSTDLSKNYITKSQYISLMKKIYKFLLPLYRDQEMTTEIEHEWHMDAAGSEGMNLHIFTKLLFRIVHQFAVHIDIDEYIELLQKIYSRITVRKVIKAQDGKTLICYPTVQVEIINEFIDGEDPFPVVGGGTESVLWEPCNDEEEEKPDHDYQWIEDAHSLTVSKRKKRKLLAQVDEDEQNQTLPAFVIKEAVSYKENVVYYSSSGDYKPKNDDVVTHALADLNDVLPLGYPTEQFFTFLKNDVHYRLEEAKKARKEALARMKREVLETGGAMKEAHLKREEDTGMISPAIGDYYYTPIFVKNIDAKINIRCKAKLVDTQFNAIRIIIKDTLTLNIRQEMDNPKKNIINGLVKTRASLTGNEPSTEINKFGYNPVLQRRIKFKQAPIFSKNGHIEFINIFYMLQHPDYEAAYRCDYQKFEKSSKLAIKPNEDFQRDEDFIPAETSYKKMRMIMLVKKFETVYTETLNADETDQKRIDKIVEREETRKKSVRNSDPLNTKGVGETYEEKSLIKMMQGPFYKLISKDGIKDDHFITCAQQDLIDYASAQPQKVLVLGKPRSGKTTLCKLLAQRLDLLHINLENWLAKLLKKIKEKPEDEVEPEEGQVPVKYYSDLEDAVNLALKSGEGPSQEQIVQILKEEMNSPQAKTKGFLLDLTYNQQNDTWAKIIRQHQLLGSLDYSGKQQEFSHVVELDLDDDDIKLRAKYMRLDIEDQRPFIESAKVFSKWERDERAKPKPKKLDDEGNEIEEEEIPEDDPNYVKPLIEKNLIFRVQDTETFISEELQYYNSAERPGMDDMIVRLYNHQYLKLDAAGKTPSELADSAEWLLKPNQYIPLRPVPRHLEGGAGDFKALLTDPIPGPNGEEQPEGTLPRQYSLWQQTDPVALFNGKVIQGLPDQSVSYANNMFVFSSEDNLKAFVLDPKKYLQAKPIMPSKYRIMMIGPRGIGVHTQADKLYSQYGWKVVDYQKLVKERLQAILKEDLRLPNNVIPGESEIGLKHEEIEDIKLGKPMPSWKFIPWILDHLGFELMKKKPPPPVEEEPINPDDLNEEDRAKWEKEQKKKAAEELAKQKLEEQKQNEKEQLRQKRKAAMEAGAGADELAELESLKDPVEDLSIDDLVLKADPETGKTPFVGGFILLGFPQSEIHAQKLKAHGIEFDKIIVLNDQSEEDPGKSVKQRMSSDMHYDWESEVEKTQKILAVAKEHLGEELCKEISGVGDINNVAIRIRAEIDPYFVRVDNPEDVRVSADLGEEDKRLPKGDFGDYCPVTYVKDGWLAKGDSQFESTVYGKTFVFVGEKEQEEFKFNPSKFLPGKEGPSTVPLLPPPPKIMILGQKGSGISTQIKLLVDKYKLDSINLKQEFVSRMRKEKDSRKRKRLLNRGFKPPLPAEEEGQEPPPDPEIEDDPEDFEKDTHEKELLKLIQDSNKGLIIDGTWNNFPEDTITGAPNPDGASYANLLIESRRPPEIFIILKCNEPSSIARMIDKQKINNEFKKQIQEREEKKTIKRDEDRKAKRAELEEAIKSAPEDEEKTMDDKIADMEEAMKQWEVDRKAEEEDADKNDEEMPNEEAMIEKELEVLRAQREQDEEFLTAFSEAIKEKGYPVLDNIKTDTSAEYVFVKLVDKLQDNFLRRDDLIEKQLAQPLKLKELPFYEQSYTYQSSKFGINCPINQSNPSKTREFAVLYRERIYYPSSSEERTMLLNQPSKFTKGVEAVPNDVIILPKIIVLGASKSGKTNLCKQISSKTGAIHLQLDEIIESYVDTKSKIYVSRDCLYVEKLMKLLRSDGKALEDNLIVPLVVKRLQQRDCLSKGWIIEDFPKTRAQAIALAKVGINPQNVINLRIQNESVYQRVQKDIDSYISQKQKEEEDRLAKLAAAAEDDDGENKPKKQTVIEVVPDEVFGSNKTILAQRLRQYESNSMHVLAFYQNIYNSLQEIDSKKSKWYVQDCALQVIEANIASKQNFVRAQCFKNAVPGTERPSEIQDIHCDRCILKASLSQFKYFCPVTWKNTKQLVKCTQNQENCVFYENSFFYFKSAAEKEMFISNPRRFVNNIIFSSSKGIPFRLKAHKAAEIIAQEKSVQGYCPVTLIDEAKVVKGDPLLIVQYKDAKLSFENELKLQKFLLGPAKYHRVDLPVKMPPQEDPVSLYALQGAEESTTFLEQALGSIVTKGLREVSENRLKYPNMTVKETMLKLFALFLKAENPANTDYMKEKYIGRMRQFIERCEMAEELNDLAEEKLKKQKEGKNKWPDFKEKYYNELGKNYDEVLAQSLKEKTTGFQVYLK